MLCPSHVQRQCHGRREEGWYLSCYEVTAGKEMAHTRQGIAAEGD